MQTGCVTLTLQTGWPRSCLHPLHSGEFPARSRCFSDAPALSAETWRNVRGSNRRVDVQQEFKIILTYQWRKKMNDWRILYFWIARLALSRELAQLLLQAPQLLVPEMLLLLHVQQPLTGILLYLNNIWRQEEEKWHAAIWEHQTSASSSPFKICVTILLVSVCRSNRAWCSALTCRRVSGWLLLMKATRASPVSSRSWNLWPCAIPGGHGSHRGWMLFCAASTAEE